MSAPLQQPAGPIARPRRRRGRRWLGWFLATLVLLAAVGVLFKPTAVAYVLTHPAHKALTADPLDYGLTYANVTFPSARDGTVLRGWYMPAASPSDRTVVLAHGYAGNRLAEKMALPVAKALVARGFNVLAFDFGGSGESGGALVTVGLREQWDLVAAVQYARSRGARYVGLQGWSMGAATAVLAMADDSGVQAAVADSPFSDLHTYLAQNLPVWSHLPGAFTPYMLWVIRTFYGTDDRLVNPAAVVASIHRPILFIHADQDPLIPPSESQRLLAAAQNPQDQLWLVHYNIHAWGYLADPQAYTDRITAFFDQNLR